MRSVAAIALSVCALAATPAAHATVIVNPTEDVMTSAFFFPPNFVRGYAGDNRNVHRVASDNAFGVGPETVYIQFDSADFAGLSALPEATLSLTSFPGGFSADASSGNPFLVSAHAVNLDPFTEIIDDTTAGSVGFVDFFNNNILAADPAAITSVDSFGIVEFDVTSIVNDWIAGNNSIFVIALTGKNDPGTTDFLHGFLNNTENPGATFLTIPEPASAMLITAVGLAGLTRRRR
ncbi:MAG: PEP-CTERM sorting domain-containing protein [Planctomycetota bacterium]